MNIAVLPCGPRMSKLSSDWQFVLPYAAMSIPIALIGLSGAGKSTVARVLAERLGWAWADSDTLIAQAEGRPVAAIFAAEGEAYFRKREAATVAEALGRGSLVLATGGGAVLHAESRALLRERAFVAWLDAPDEALIARLRAHDEERPLLADNPAARLAALRDARAPLYAGIAHVVVATAGLTPTEVAERILEAYSTLYRPDVL